MRARMICRCVGCHHAPATPRRSRPLLRPPRKSAVERDLSTVGSGEAALALRGESVDLVL
jgi:hypothetical protein